MKIIVEVEDDDPDRLQFALQNELGQAEDVLFTQISSIEKIDESRQRREGESTLKKVAIVIFMKLKGKKDKQVSKRIIEEKLEKSEKLTSLIKAGFLTRTSCRSFSFISLDESLLSL